MTPINQKHRTVLFLTASLAGIAAVLTATLQGADTPADKPAAAGKSPTYADVQPLLKKYCYDCHGGGKAAKSQYTLDTRENALKGGKNKKPGIVAGDATKGELMRRISLAQTEKEVMPPKAKAPKVTVPPTADEIKTIADWINAGAKWE